MEKGDLRWQKGRIVYRLSATLLIALALALLALGRYGLSPQAAAAAIEAWLLLAAAVVDLRHWRVPDRLLLLALPVTLGASLLLDQPPLLSALLGASLALISFTALARFWPGGLGWGDVKLAGLIGLMVGFPAVMWALLAAMVAGGLTSLALLLAGRVHRTQRIPYAPFLALGGWLALLASSGIR